MYPNYQHFLKNDAITNTRIFELPSQVKEFLKASITSENDKADPISLEFYSQLRVLPKCLWDTLLKYRNPIGRKELMLSIQPIPTSKCLTRYRGSLCPTGSCEFVQWINRTTQLIKVQNTEQLVSTFSLAHCSRDVIKVALYNWSIYFEGDCINKIIYICL